MTKGTAMLYAYFDVWWDYSDWIQRDANADNSNCCDLKKCNM